MQGRIGEQQGRAGINLADAIGHLLHQLPVAGLTAAQRSDQGGLHLAGRLTALQATAQADVAQGKGPAGLRQRPRDQTLPLQLHLQRLPRDGLQIELHAQGLPLAEGLEALLEHPHLAGVGQPVLQGLAVELVLRHTQHDGQAGVGLQDAAAGTRQDQQIATELHHLAQVGQGASRLPQLMAQAPDLSLQPQSLIGR